MSDKIVFDVETSAKGISFYKEDLFNHILNLFGLYIGKETSGAEIVEGIQKVGMLKNITYLRKAGHFPEGLPAYIPQNNWVAKTLGNIMIENKEESEKYKSIPDALKHEYRIATVAFSTTGIQNHKDWDIEVKIGCNYRTKSGGWSEQTQETIDIHLPKMPVIK